MTAQAALNKFDTKTGQPEYLTIEIPVKLEIFNLDRDVKKQL